MANYHFEIKNINRKIGRSITDTAHYITGERLRDSRSEKVYYNKRSDVSYHNVALPDNAPPEYQDIQTLCDALEEAEHRMDSRTGRHIIGSLPNELPLEENIKIVDEYVKTYFTSQGLGAIVAIHEKHNEIDPSKDNPHVHIIVTTRTIGPHGLNRSKDREHNKVGYVEMWRRGWADVQNRAYERNELEHRVSHKSLMVQGIDREPRSHLSQVKWRELQEVSHTKAKDRDREISSESCEKAKNKSQEKSHLRVYEIELSR